MNDLVTFGQSIGIGGNQTVMAFVKIEFNRDLAGVTDPATGMRIYDHYGFEDSWIFRVSCSQDGRIFNDPNGEFPDWKWLWQENKSRYPNPTSIFKMQRPMNR